MEDPRVIVHIAGDSTHAFDSHEEYKQFANDKSQADVTWSHATIVHPRKWVDHRRCGVTLFDLMLLPFLWPCYLFYPLPR